MCQHTGCAVQMVCYLFPPLPHFTPSPTFLHTHLPTSPPSHVTVTSSLKRPTSSSHMELSHDALTSIAANIHKLRSFLPSADRFDLTADLEGTKTAAAGRCFGIENLVDPGNVAKWEKQAPKVVKGVLEILHLVALGACCVSASRCSFWCSWSTKGIADTRGCTCSRCT